MENSADEDLRSIAQSLTTLQQISSAAISLRLSLPFTRPLQRKLETLLRCGLHDAQSPSVAMRLALSVADRAVSDLTVHVQAQQHEKVSLWTAIRSHGCQFLGPAMQEEVLKLILLALEDGSSLSRKVLVLFVVQRLHLQFPQASKTSVGHVVQLLYRASCFNVIKRSEESSLMQLKEEFRNYEELRGQHDMQIVEISRDFGLRIGPEQWSCLLYGDNNHRSHMQSIIDKVLRRQTLLRNTEELIATLQKSGDPLDLSAELQPLLSLLVDLKMNTSLEADAVGLSHLDACLKAVVKVISALSRSLQLKQTHKTDHSPPAVSDGQSESGGHSNGRIKTAAVAVVDSFTSPFNSYSSPESCPEHCNESSDGDKMKLSQVLRPKPHFPEDSDEVFGVTTAMSSCSLTCMAVQCPSSSATTKDGFYHLLSPGCPSGVALSPHLSYSPCESLPFHTSSQPPFFTPPISVITNERVCTPLTGGFCPSPVVVSLHNLPGHSEFFQPVWYPTADDYNHSAVLLDAPSTSNHVDF